MKKFIMLSCVAAGLILMFIGFFTKDMNNITVGGFLLVANVLLGVKDDIVELKKSNEDLVKEIKDIRKELKRHEPDAIRDGGY